MKNLLPTLIASLFFLNLSAQRVDIDKEWFDYSYRRLPNQVLEPSFKTYSVIINKTVALEAYSNDRANELIAIEGKQKISELAHFNVTVTLNDLMIESSEVAERVEVHKDKEGKETGRSYYYYAKVVYSFEARAEVKDHAGNRLTSYTLARRDSKKEFKSSEYSKGSDAANYYNNNKLEIKAKLIDEQITEAIKSLNGSLNYDFGYPVMRTRENLWSIGSKKHLEFQPSLEAWNTAKNALSAITADAIPEDFMTNIQPAIDYYLSLPKKYTNTEAKGEKKIRYMAYYNLAQIYMLTEQFELAKEYAQNIIANDFNPKDGQKMIKEMDNLIAEMQKHNASTRHFIPDLENIEMP